MSIMLDLFCYLLNNYCVRMWGSNPIINHQISFLLQHCVIQEEPNTERKEMEKGIFNSSKRVKLRLVLFLLSLLTSVEFSYSIRRHTLSTNSVLSTNSRPKDFELLLMVIYCKIETSSPNDCSCFCERIYTRCNIALR